jgi:lipoate-protein ligase A
METRVFDTGSRSGPENDAIDRASLTGSGGEGWLRFWRSMPTASLGAHQAAERELRVGYCRDRGIAIVRRVSGGGALYLDEQQFGFSLTVPRERVFPGLGLAQILRRFGEALAAGLARLGIAAAFMPFNDLEIDGRKIASLYLAARGPQLLLHGTVLIDTDIRTMLEALRVPTEKLSRDGLAAARDRLVTLRECLGGAPVEPELRSALEEGLASTLGLTLRPEAEAPAFVASSRIEYPPEDGIWDEAAADWLEALWKCEGGTLRARGRFSADGSRLDRLALAGDLQLAPEDALARLAEQLEGAELRALARYVESFFAGSNIETVGFGAADVMRMLHLIADKRRAIDEIGLKADDVNALMVHADDEAPARAILEQASVMLVPYCAKPDWCKWRHQDGCTECGLCEVGEAYRLARERGMRVTTIVRYEHLVETLGRMKRDGEPAYVGMCCSNFFLKRHRAFRDAGIPAVLMDISGANCYELQQEDQAYAGNFQAKATLNEDLLRRVMRFVPPVRRESH